MENKRVTVETEESDSYLEISDPSVLVADPVVSVRMITYNHGPYIAQAIEGVVMQETEYPFELIIGDDCSTDNTRQIALDYQKKYPEIIRILAWKRNVGGPRNSKLVGESCRGKYIAMCEGDDYWVSPLKLQKQVDLLSNNPDCALCFGRSFVLDNGELKEDPPFPVSRGNLSHLVANVDFKTPSAVYRGGAVKFPDKYIKGAHFLFSLAAENGDVLYLDDLVCVYRVHHGGVWSGGSELERYHMTVSNLRPRIAHLRSRGFSDARNSLIGKYISSSTEFFIVFLKERDFKNALRALVFSFYYFIRKEHVGFLKRLVSRRS